MAFDIMFAGSRALPTGNYPVSASSDKPSFAQTTLAFEMNLSLQTTDRDVYNAFDWIREMGGFQSGIRRFFILVLYILTYKNYEAYMVSNLYNSSEIDEEREENGTKKAKRKEISLKQG